MTENPGRTTDKELISSFLANKMDKSKQKDATLLAYARHLRKFSTAMSRRGSSLLEATKEDVRRYMDEFDAQFSKATSNMVRCSLRIFYRFLFDQGYREDNLTADLPTKSVSYTRVSTIDPKWTSEVQRLIDSIPIDHPVDIRDKVLVMLLFLTGLEISRLLELRIDNFTRDGVLRLKRSQFFSLEIQIPQEKMSLILKYIDDARDYFVDPMAADDWRLFPSKKSDGFCRQAAWKMIVRRSAAVGSELTPRSIRYASMCILLGKGHSQDEICQILDLSRDRIRRVCEALIRSQEGTTALEPMLRSA